MHKIEPEAWKHGTLTATKEEGEGQLDWKEGEGTS